MFDTLHDRLAHTMKGLRGKPRLTEEVLEETTTQLRVALLEADVALPVVRDFIAAVKDKARQQELSQALNPAQHVISIVNEELTRILGGQTRRLRLAKTPPTVIMLAGLQGAGKTTLAGKLARWLTQQGHTPLLVACDLQRPNAVQQLQVMGHRAGVAVYAPQPGNGVGDPVQVARHSIEVARMRQHDVVIVDTAGRLGVDADMMAQAAAIKAAVTPDEVLFVVDAMIGQDAVTTAQAFLDGVDFDAVVLSKLDGDARGGAALSIANLTGRPIMFASTGEKLKDFDLFHPDRMASRILGMGDVMTLIEQAQRSFDDKQAEQMAGKLLSGKDFTFDDFLQQMEGLRKMGSMSGLLKMLPGMSQYREQINQIDDRELDRTKAIIQSMTPAERADPKILNGSRRARIARGCGRQVSEINELVQRFGQAQKMMRSLSQGAGIPGLPGLGGMGGKKAKAGRSGKGGKQRSGNPAKRAAAQADQEAPTAAELSATMQNFQLPGALREQFEAMKNQNEQ